MTAARRQVRLQLTEEEARGVHAALQDALAANLLAPSFADAASRVLDRLGDKVPAWLDRAPIGGEAGYLIAAEAVLRVLVAGEDRGRTALTEVELAHGLDEAKPAGVTVTDVLARMRRESLVRVLPVRAGQPAWWSTAPAGRRLLTSRNDTDTANEWRVEDAEALAELIFREHRPGRDAHRPSVQTIGHLADSAFEQLADELRVAGLLEPPGEDPNSLELTTRGALFAEDRVRATLPRHFFLWELPAPPLPYRRGLPLRVNWNDRRCSCSSGHAAWLQRTTKTKLRQTLLRDGAVEWNCRWCGRRWLIFLMAYLPDDRPAYDEPQMAVYLRPAWRPR